MLHLPKSMLSMSKEYPALKLFLFLFLPFPEEAGGGAGRGGRAVGGAASTADIVLNQPNTLL